MEKKICVIGGDLRFLRLTEMLAKDGFKVYTYGLEKADNIKKIENVFCRATLEQTVKESNDIITSIPFSSDDIYINSPYSNEKIRIEDLIKESTGKKVYAGSIKKDVIDFADKNNVEIIDLLEKEELVVLNAIPTAEGAISLCIQETPKTLHNSNVLVMGFGRIGKILAKMLLGIGANVYCEARKEEDIAWIKALRI